VETPVAAVEEEEFEVPDAMEEAEIPEEVVAEAVEETVDEAVEETVDEVVAETPEEAVAEA
jgi:hypothetical protein